jgi:hypothetical protein
MSLPPQRKVPEFVQRLLGGLENSSRELLKALIETRIAPDRREKD